MLGFIKIFLQGLLYVVLLPLIILVLALYAAYCIIIFIYMAIRSVIVFFMGGTPLGDLPEDVEAKRILMEREQVKNQDPTQTLANAIAQSSMQIAQNMYAQQGAPEVTPTETTNEDTYENTIEEMDDGNSY